MTLTLRTAPREHRFLPRGKYWNDLREERVGVCLHYDGSTSDVGGLGWLQGLDVKASYNLVVLDDGSWGVIAPLDKRAWHAGVCRPSDPRLPYGDANSALYGICALTNDKVDVTQPQVLTCAWLTARIFAAHGWPLTDAYRVVTHRSEAWKRGRKKDPEGGDLSNPIMSADDVRLLLPLFVDVEPMPGIGL